MILFATLMEVHACCATVAILHRWCGDLSKSISVICPSALTFNHLSVNLSPTSCPKSRSVPTASFTSFAVPRFCHVMCIGAGREPQPNAFQRSRQSRLCHRRSRGSPACEPLTQSAAAKPHGWALCRHHRHHSLQFFAQSRELLCSCLSWLGRRTRLTLHPQRMCSLGVGIHASEFSQTSFQPSCADRPSRMSKKSSPHVAPNKNASSAYASTFSSPFSLRISTARRFSIVSSIAWCKARQARRATCLSPRSTLSLCTSYREGTDEECDVRHNCIKTGAFETMGARAAERRHKRPPVLTPVPQFPRSGNCRRCAQPPNRHQALSSAQLKQCRLPTKLLQRRTPHQY